MSMRTFKITVNGTVYDVAVEETTSGAAAAPAAAPAPAAAAPAAPVAGRGSTEVKSPIQGTVVKVSAAVGASVKRGDCVCVIEAMKMEYDIVAPVDGTIATLETSRVATVEEGKILFTLK